MNRVQLQPLFSFLIACFVLFLASGWGVEVKACGSKTVIKVDSQSDFDNIGSDLLNLISDGSKNIVVEFAKGEYYYKNQHIFWVEKHYPEVSISFKGNDATIFSAGKDLLKGGQGVKYIEGAGFIDAEGKDFQNFSSMFQSDAMVEILDEGTKQCRIHCLELEGLGRVDCTNSRIRLTSWYTSFLYPVTRISNGYVYFTAENLTPGLAPYGNYNVNYDYTVGKFFPRFRLINALVGGCEVVSTITGLVNKSSVDVIHQCEASHFIYLINCKLKKLTIEGFSIIGCRADSQMIRFKNLEVESLILRNSMFSAARGIVFYAESTDNIKVERCIFHDNYQDVLCLSNSCANAVIQNNEFYNNGKGVRNSFCIICRGGNYKIRHNELRNFNYGAIGVGVWYKSSKGSLPSYGVVECNHIYFTPDYAKDKSNWTLVDSGAIYLWSKNDGAIIRNNFIHDYEGMGSNRGIYCDDGTCNCSVYGNIILNVKGYSIDLRRSLTLDKLDLGLKSNINNHIFGNSFNSRFRFQGRIDDTTSIKGGNIILVEDESSMPIIIEDNLVKESEDHTLKYDHQKWYRKGQRLIR